MDHGKLKKNLILRPVKSTATKDNAEAFYEKNEAAAIREEK